MLRRQASSLLFWNRRAVMSSQRGLNKSALGGGGWGGLTGRVDQAVCSPLSEVARGRGSGAENREGERLRFFDFSARKCQIVPCLLPIARGGLLTKRDGENAAEIAELSERSQIALDAASVEDVVTIDLVKVRSCFDRLTKVARL